MQKIILSVLLCLMFGLKSVQQTNPPAMPPSSNYISASQEFLYAVRTDDSSAIAWKDMLAAANQDSLLAELDTEDKGKAFWLNLYNAFTQFALRKDPDKYRNRNKFFKSTQFVVAGKELSLDDMEHGILRHSKIKWSLGYLGKWFPSAFEKKFRLKKADYRIHFALNCGAKSCPPIAFYKPEQLDKQLDLATRTYLKNDAAYSSEKNQVELPVLMSWFRADFGGKKGIYRILRDLKIIPADRKPGMKFRKYDWSLYLENFKNE